MQKIGATFIYVISISYLCSRIQSIPPDSDDAALKGSSCYELSSHDYLKRHVYGSMPPARNHYLTL